MRSLIFDNSVKKFMDDKRTHKDTNSNVYHLELDLDMDNNIITPIEFLGSMFWNYFGSWIFKSNVSLQVVKFDFYFELTLKDINNDTIDNQLLIILTMPFDCGVDLNNYDYDFIFEPSERGLKITQK